MERITYIRQVQYDDLRFVEKTGEHSSVIVLFADDFTICLLARIKAPAAACLGKVRAGLLGHALQQMRRLPEYRAGQARIVVACTADPSLGQAA